jgi:GTPase
MRQLWIGLVEVLTEPDDGEGNTRAFTNVIAWAESAEGYTTCVSGVLEEYGWALLGTENVRLVSPESNYEAEISEIIERAKSIPKACIFSTLHYYPSRPA